MHIIRPVWLSHGGEKKDFEVYSCHVSADGARLVTSAGGMRLGETFLDVDKAINVGQMATFESGPPRPFSTRATRATQNLSSLPR